jgi:serine protease Do
MRKVLLSILIVLAPVLAGAGFQFALSTDMLFVEGVRLDQAKLYIYQSTNYLPLRAVAEALGANVNYVKGRIEITPRKKYKAQDAVALADTANSVVLIHATKDDGVWKGSGFAVGDGSLIVTNEHVIRNANKLEAKSQAEDTFSTLEVVKVDAALDIAILKVNKKYVPLKLGDSDKVKFYGGVIAISHTKGAEQVDWEAGNILLQKKVIDGNEYIVTNAYTSFGSSGGAMLDENGVVIGVIQGKQGEEYTLAVHINKVKKLLSTLS